MESHSTRRAAAYALRRAHRLNGQLAAAVVHGEYSLEEAKTRQAVEDRLEELLRQGIEPKKAAHVVAGELELNQARDAHSGGVAQVLEALPHVPPGKARTLVKKKGPSGAIAVLRAEEAKALAEVEEWKRQFENAWTRRRLKEASAHCHTLGLDHPGMQMLLLDLCSLEEARERYEHPERFPVGERAQLISDELARRAPPPTPKTTTRRAFRPRFETEGRQHPDLPPLSRQGARVVRHYPATLVKEVLSELREPRDAYGRWLQGLLDRLYASRMMGSELGRYRERGLRLHDAYRAMSDEERTALEEHYPDSQEPFEERERRYREAMGQWDEGLDSHAKLAS